MESSFKHGGNVLSARSLLNHLRICIANDYLPSANCYIILWHINNQLTEKGESSINFRLLIGSSKLLNKDLIPMFIAVNDSKVLSVLIKVLTNVIAPIESIILGSKQYVNEFEHSNVIQLKQLLQTNKALWIDSRSIKRIIQIIKNYIEEVNLSKPLGCFNIYAVPIISDCLLLIRNILLEDEDQYQRKILLILFCEQFGETLMVLIHDSMRRKWVAQIFELFALVFQNDDVASEINTTIINYSLNITPSHHQVPVKDKVGSKFLFKKSICNLQSHSSKTEGKISETEGKISETEGNISGIQPRGMRHKLEVDSGKHNAVIVDTVAKNTDTKLPKNMFKTLPTHDEKDEESLDRNIVILQLKKFAIQFLQNGFSAIVDEGYSIILNTQHNIDSSHFFWILIYLCRFCKFNKIELKLIRGIISLKLIKNVASEGHHIAKKLTMAKHQKPDDVHIYVRQLYSVIMVIKEVVETIEFYRKTSIALFKNTDLLQDLDFNSSPASITWKEDIMSLFPMLINFYDSDLQTFEYLVDLIITNHKLILLLDNLDSWTSDDTTEHFKRFATADIMYKYGAVLQNYNKNGELVNDAIFTLIRSVFRDCEINSVILQPIILETLMKITEHEYYPCKKWRDLIERVLNLKKFRTICSDYAKSRTAQNRQQK